MKQKRWITVLAVALAAATLAAQTRLGTPQLTPGESGRVWVNHNNQVRQARIEGAVLVEEGADLVLRFSGVAPAWRTEQRIVPDPPAALALAATPVAGSLVVARNGLLQWEGDDYAVEGRTVTLAYAVAGDRIVLRYQVAEAP